MEDSRVVSRVSCSFSGPLFVDRLLQIATADGALQDQLEPALALGILVSRAPAQPKRPRQPHERFGLGIPAAGPRTELLPGDDLPRGGFRGWRTTGPHQGGKSHREREDMPSRRPGRGPARHVGAFYRRTARRRAGSPWPSAGPTGDPRSSRCLLSGSALPFACLAIARMPLSIEVACPWKTRR